MNQNRLDKILKKMAHAGIDQMIICSPATIFYLTGKWIEPGERLLAIFINSSGKKRFFINKLFPIQTTPELEFELFTDSDDPIAILAEDVDPEKPLTVEKDWPAHFLIRLMDRLTGTKFQNASPVIDSVRMIKDAEEIDLMRKASAINDLAMSELVSLLPSGQTEDELCQQLLKIFQKHNTPKFSFYPSIQFGVNASDPHHESGNTKVQSGDSVVMDIGGRTNNYCSDMTRTVFFGEPMDELKNIYNIVKDAQQNSVDTIKPGARFCDIDAAARNTIEAAGYGEFFTHRTGHNIGIEVHEPPDVGEMNKSAVEPGMIFSIEPGIYLPGKGGVRIEDLVLVTENGVERLNNYTRELQII